MKFIVIAALAGLACVMAPTESAEARKPPPEPEIRSQTRVELGHTDNVRSSEPGPNVESASFVSARLEVEREQKRKDALPDEMRLRLFGRVFDGFSNRDFVDLEAMAAYQVGRVSDWLVETGYAPRRLRLEETATEPNAYFAEYRVGTGFQTRFGEGWRGRVRLDAQARYDDYRSGFDERDATVGSLGAEVRYPLFSSWAVRGKVRRRVRDADRDEHDRDEFDMTVGADGPIARWAKLSLRLTRSDRDYTVSAPSDLFGRNKNFGRNDDIDVFESKLTVPLSDGSPWAVTARYMFRDSDSTRLSRNFDVSEVGIGFVYTPQ